MFDDVWKGVTTILGYGTMVTLVIWKVLKSTSHWRFLRKSISFSVCTSWCVKSSKSTQFRTCLTSVTCLVPVSVVPTAGHIGPLSAPGRGHQLTTLPSAAASDALLHSRIKSRPSLAFPLAAAHPRRGSPWRGKGWLRKRKQVTAAGRPLPTCAGPSWPGWGAKRKNFNYMESWHLRYRSGGSWCCDTCILFSASQYNIVALVVMRM